MTDSGEPTWDGDGYQIFPSGDVHVVRLTKPDADLRVGLDDDQARELAADLLRSVDAADGGEA